MTLGFRLIYNTISQFSSRVVSTICNLLIFFLIARNLSPEILGDFITVTTYVALFTVVADFGLNGIVVKKLVQESENEKADFQQLLGLRIFLIFVSIFLALAVLAFVPHSSVVKLGIIAGVFLIAAQGLFNTAAAAFQAKARYDQFALADSLGSVLTLLLIFAAVRLELGLFLIVILFVAGNFAKTVVGLFLARKLINFSAPTWDTSQWKNLLLASLPLGLVVVFSQVNANIDKQIVALYQPEIINGITAAVAVGIYGLSYRIFDFGIALPTYIVNASYPVMLSTQKDNPQNFAAGVRNLAVILFSLGLIGAIVGWLLAPTVLSFFGDYQAAVPPLRVLLLGLPIFFVTSLLVWVAVTLEKQILLPAIYGGAVLINVVLNLIFVPRFGYIASAWVTIVTEVSIFALLLLILREIYLPKRELINEQAS